MSHDTSLDLGAGAVDTEAPSTTRHNCEYGTSECRSNRHLTRRNDKENSSPELLGHVNKNNLSPASVTTRPFVPTLVFIPNIALSSFDQSLLRLNDRCLRRSSYFSFSSEYLIAFTTAAGRYPSTMLYDCSHKCLVCPKLNNAAPCTHCECSYYCSIECKVVDLLVHRTLCKSFAQFKTRPGPAQRRAIYLPVDGPNPEFGWLKLDEKIQHDFVDTVAIRKDFLGDSGNFYVTTIEQDMVSMRRTYDRHPPIIVLVYGETPPYTDQPLNRSISTLLGQETHGVRGPVIAYGLLFPNNEEDGGRYSVTDLDTTDLPVITN